MECGARKRGSEQRCAAPAMANGRCRIHGGRSPGAPLKHGRYSLVHRQSLAAKVEQFLADPTPGDLTHELAMSRALLQDWLERFPDGTNLRYEDIRATQELLRDIGQTVERIHRIIATNALTAADVHYVKVRLADILVKYIDEPDRRIACLDELERSFRAPGGRTDPGPGNGSGTGRAALGPVP